MKLIVTSFLLMLCGIITYAQESSYQSMFLDTTLTNHANAVVREQSIKIEIESIDEMHIKTHRVVTVLNKYGDKFVGAYDFYDDESRTIKDQEAFVYNKLGEEIKKIKGRHFKDRSYVQEGNLYTDDRVSYLDYTPNEYPYTVVYESEIESNNTAFIQPWQPISGYYLSVASSTYSIINPSHIPIRYKEVNLEDKEIQKKVSKFDVFYKAENIPAFTYEKYSPGLYEIVPKVKVALEDFSLVGVSGHAKTWQEFGKWQYKNLLKGRDQLPAKTIQEVNELVKNAATDYDKARLIYKYMQNRTRYISVQLGIGGWQPIEAEEVDRMQYGDCKGLTNYMKALLASQGIKSNYAVVNAGEEQKSMDPDFVSMQGNHVILNVPDIADADVWLECTSQTLPFNYLGDFTDNRYVFLVKEDGGEVVKTPEYSSEENTENIACNIVLKQDAFEAKIVKENKGIFYENNFRIQVATEEDQDRHYKKLFRNLRGIHIEKMNFEDDKKNAKFSEDLEITGKSFFTKAGTRLLLPLNFMKADVSNVPHKKDRLYPIVVRRGFSNKAIFTFTIPEDYKIEALPKPIHVENEFGNFDLDVKASKENTNQIVVTRNVQLVQGKWETSKYETFRKFFNNINILSNQKAVLIKK
ncbi:DUF3857 domain-containing protein [Zunongwangia sp.]|uniref:DUF3857 domain-containing protein n=1 Tax=Zunongwangia sp. TaxID=1965325 RepID=UPI003AA7D413